MKKVHVPSLLICILFLIIIFGLCIFKSDGSILFAQISARPEQTVTDFFNAVKAGNEEKACSLLFGYSDIGLKKDAETQEGEQLIEVLRNSYEFTLSGSGARKGDKASQTVVFSHLDLNAFTSAVIANAQSGETFESALQRQLSDAANYITSDILTVNLKYSDGTWKILPEEALFVAIRGGLT